MDVTLHDWLITFGEDQGLQVGQFPLFFNRAYLVHGMGEGWWERVVSFILPAWSNVAMATCFDARGRIATGEGRRGTSE